MVDLVELNTRGGTMFIRKFVAGAVLASGLAIAGGA